MVLNPQLRKNLKLAFSSKFDFLDINIDWTRHTITIIYIEDKCNIILQSLKNFQPQTFLFFLIL